MVSPGSPLIGEPGQIAQLSPDGRLSVCRALLITFPAEAIVNCTDKYMTISTTAIPGASHQITNSAGSELRNHLHYNYPLGLRVGDALSTPSFGMRNCHWIIHVNGPNFTTGTRAAMPLLRHLLTDCYRRALEEAFKLGARSVAFPCISTGNMGWPRGEAARIGVSVVRAWLRHPIYGAARGGVIEKVIFLCDPVGKQAHQKQAWCAAFRELYPQISLSRRLSRTCFQDYVDKQEMRRLEKHSNQLVENQKGVSVVPVSQLRSPVLTREVRNEVRRSRRNRKRPDRYGY